MCLGPCVDILSAQREHVDHLQCSQNHIWRIFPFRLFRDFPLSLEPTLEHSGTQLDDTTITVIDLTVFLVMCQYDSNYCAITFHGRCGNGTVWNDLTLRRQLMKMMTWVMMMTSGLADFTPHPRLTLTLLNLIFFFIIISEETPGLHQLLCFCVSLSLPPPQPPSPLLFLLASRCWQQIPGWPAGVVLV